MSTKRRLVIKNAYGPDEDRADERYDVFLDGNHVGDLSRYPEDDVFEFSADLDFESVLMRLSYGLSPDGYTSVNAFRRDFKDVMGIE